MTHPLQFNANPTFTAAPRAGQSVPVTTGTIFSIFLQMSTDTLHYHARPESVTAMLDKKHKILLGPLDLDALGVNSKTPERLGVSAKTFSRYKSSGFPPAMFMALRVLAGDLAALGGRKWEGFRMVEGQLITDQGREYGPGDIRVIDYQAANYAAIQREKRATLRQRDQARAELEQMRAELMEARQRIQDAERLALAAASRALLPDPVNALDNGHSVAGAVQPETVGQVAHLVGRKTSKG